MKVLFFNEKRVKWLTLHKSFNKISYFLVATFSQERKGIRARKKDKEGKGEKVEIEEKRERKLKRKNDRR